MKDIKQRINHEWLLLVSVFLLALFFRFFQITKVPLSLNWDEATFGYNAYSILKTGADEYGQKFPLSFKSIGDYKCPLYIYLMVPIIKLFGLNEFSVRFLPSFLGALTVPLLFMIVKELFKDKKIAFISSLILAISPWHLQFTRAGADVAVSSFFLILGIWLFLKSVNSAQKRFLFYSLSVISFVLTFYAYYGERFFTPLMCLVLIWIYREQVLKTKKEFLKSVLLGVIAFLPLAGSLISSGHQGKILMTTVLGYQPSLEYLAQMRKEDKNQIIFNIFHNDFVGKGIAIISHYLNHFSPSFLFINGPQDNRQRIEGMGMLYFSDIILLLLGFWLFVTNRQKKGYFLVLCWLAVAPLPAAITRDLVHARRSFNMIYPLSIIMALGLVFLIEKIKSIKNRFFKIFISAVLLIFFFWSFVFYLLSYYIFTPLRTYKGPGGWQYGYKELVEFVSPLKSKYNQVIVDTFYQGPYAFFLFYEKYPPENYQKQAVLVKENDWSLGEGKGYDNYLFRKTFWPNDRGTKNILFAGPPESIPKRDIDPRQARLLKIIYFPDGTEAFYIVETTP